MQLGCASAGERVDLLRQRGGQFAAAGGDHAGHVVDRLVGVQLGALAAGVGQSVNGVAMDVQQTQLEDLEQADWAGADDQGVGLCHGRVGEWAGKAVSRRGALSA